jgi:cation diffusion facilitator family transporter
MFAAPGVYHQLSQRVFRVSLPTTNITDAATNVRNRIDPELGYYGVSRVAEKLLGVTAFEFSNSVTGLFGSLGAYHSKLHEIYAGTVRGHPQPLGGPSGSTAEQRHKVRVALVSAAVSVSLTTVKVVIASLTGSLGLISESAHSGLDTIASVITVFTVHVAARPADENHPYGHGRFEYISAGVQGLLLVGTGGSIAVESIRRMFFVDVPVQPSAWAFLVMATCIGVDFWRSRVLLSAAHRYQSRALEADALNFRTDMFTSAVVVLGFGMTTWSDRLGPGRAVLLKGDAIAALIVGAVTLQTGAALLWRSVQTLVDESPRGLAARMTTAARSVPGVLSAKPVRVRESGNRVFADVVVKTSRTRSLAQAHETAEQVEEALRSVDDRSETVVHVEPTTGPSETVTDAIRAVALRLGFSTHHETVFRLDGELEAFLHLEVPPDLPLLTADLAVHQLIDALQEDQPQLRRVFVHIEPAEPPVTSCRPINVLQDEVAGQIKGLVRATVPDHHLDELRVSQAGERYDVSFTWTFPADHTVEEVHGHTEVLEQVLREHVPQLHRVMIRSIPHAGS